MRLVATAVLDGQVRPIAMAPGLSRLAKLEKPGQVGSFSGSALKKTWRVAQCEVPLDSRGLVPMIIPVEQCFEQKFSHIAKAGSAPPRIPGTLSHENGVLAPDEHSESQQIKMNSDQILLVSRGRKHLRCWDPAGEERTRRRH